MQEEEKNNPSNFWKRALSVEPQVSLVSGVVFVCFAYMLLNEMK